MFENEVANEISVTLIVCSKNFNASVVSLFEQKSKHAAIYLKIQLLEFGLQAQARISKFQALLHGQHLPYFSLQNILTLISNQQFIFNANRLQFC